jgi:glutathione S-transferase
MSLQLHYTPRSHFSRKVRLLLDAYGLECALIDAGNVGEDRADAFGPNPLLKVPCLIDDGRAVFDSDHIAQYLTERHAPDDPYGVFTREPRRLNARAVMNGVMAAEVELILTERSGLDIHAHPCFDKLRASMRGGLDWLEREAELFEGPLDYAGLHLVALLDHLRLYGLVTLSQPRLRAAAERISRQTWVARSAPR